MSQLKKKCVFGSDDDDDESEKNDVLVTQQAKKVRKMDILLENLKREQALRKINHTDSAQEKQVDILSTESTNLVIKYLAPEIDENILLHEFGRFGPIGSVKIMWPRDDEQRRRGWNTGFVAFMNKKDATSALNTMAGTLFHNHRLSMNWGDPVSLPAVPIWPLSGVVTAKPESTRERILDGPPPKEKVRGIGPDMIVKPPDDPKTRFIIDAMAMFVARDGIEFEQAIIEKEKENDEFLFLSEYHSVEHLYYRWRVWSLSNGDTLSLWRVEPFLICKDGSLWVPPPTSLLNARENQESTTTFDLGEKPLGEAERMHLNKLLCSLTSKRQSISNAMVFIIENADSCMEIYRTIAELIISDQTIAPKKLDLLNLTSDILYNTSAPVRNASQYRTIIQESLPDIFESLQYSYINASSRIMQETIRKHILRILRVWREWHMFHDSFLSSLQCQFLHKHRVDPSGRIQKDEKHVDLDYKIALEAMDDESLANECRQKAISLKGTKEEQIEKLLIVRSYMT